jgi:protein-disulfide isomerase
VLIAGAVVLTRTNVSNNSTGKTNKATNAVESGQQVNQDIVIKPITASDHLLGNPAAELAIVVFTDTECPFCKTFHGTMQRVADTYGKSGSVLWVYRHFPLEQLHPKAPKEAEATECATELGGKEAFWDYINKVFEITPSNNGLDAAQLPLIAKGLGINENEFKACLASGKYADKVEESYNEAINAGGRGTPFSVLVSKTPMTDKTISTIKSLTVTLPSDTIIFGNDKKHIALSGALPYTLIQKILDTITSK